MERDELLRITCDVVRAQAAGCSDSVEADTPLGPEGLGIDSIGCLEIVLELERRTGIRLRDESLTAEAFASPASLAAQLARASHS
jgi:acyl carrier protein